MSGIRKLLPGIIGLALCFLSVASVGAVENAIPPGSGRQELSSSVLPRVRRTPGDEPSEASSHSHSSAPLGCPRCTMLSQ